MQSYAAAAEALVQQKLLSSIVLDLSMHAMQTGIAAVMGSWDEWSTTNSGEPLCLV